MADDLKKQMRRFESLIGFKEKLNVVSRKSMKELIEALSSKYKNDVYNSLRLHRLEFFHDLIESQRKKKEKQEKASILKIKLKQKQPRKMAVKEENKPIDEEQQQLKDKIEVELKTSDEETKIRAEDIDDWSRRIRTSKGRKVKFPIKDNENYCETFFERQNIKMIEANKENEFHSSKKCIINNLRSSQKNECMDNKKIKSIYENINLVPVVTKRVLGDCENIHKQTRSKFYESIVKPSDYQIMKKEFLDEDIKPKSAKIKTETFDSEPLESNFANIDDDFNLGSEETCEDEDYKNVEENRESYLNETIAFDENAISQNALCNSIKFNWRNNCKKSEEQLVLEDAYMRVNRHDIIFPCCVCNPNIPPSWMIHMR